MVPENTDQRMTVWERAGLAWQVTKRILRADEAKGDPVFPRGHATEWLDSWGKPWVAGIPGCTINYATEVGDLTTSSLVMAVVNFVGTMLAEAPPEVVVYDKQNKPTVIPNHPLTLLLQNPNPYYDFSTLMKSLALSYLIGGNSYWLKQRDPKNYLQVVGLWYLPHFLIKPAWNRDDPQDFTSKYIYRVDGRRVDYIPEDIVHIRATPDPNDPRLGMGVFLPVLEEIFGDKKAANFAAVLFKNLGIVQYVISPPKPSAGEGGSGLGPGFGFGKDENKARAKALQIQDSFIRATTGENAGKPVVNTIPLEITKLSFSPTELDMKELRKVPESRVAGVTGIPASVLQFLVGLEHGTSYASYEQAREQGYEQVIIPLQRIIAAAINKYLLPEFADGDGRRQEFRFDLTNVRVLQDDQDKLFTRLNTAVSGGWLRVDKALAAVGQDSTPEDQVFLRSKNIDVVPATEEAARALAERQKLIDTLNPKPLPPPVPPLQLGTGDNSDLPEDGERVIAGQTVLSTIRKQLRAALTNGHTPEEKQLARQVMGLLGTGEKASVSYEGMTLWREPTDLERTIKIKAIADAFDEGQRRLEKELSSLREKLIKDAVAGIIKLSPADYHTLVLAAPAKATESLREELQSIYDRGRELVVDELAAQGATDLGGIGEADAEDEERLDELADVTASRVINDVQSRAIGAAAALAVVGATAAGLQADLQDAIEAGSTSYISSAAAEVDHAAFGLGRVAEAEARQDIIAEVYYSAILDSGTCEPCADVDGETGATPDDITACPNPDCEGGARCRCVQIYVYDDSSKSKKKDLKYDGQPRDEQGRFAEGGGGGDSNASEGGGNPNNSDVGTHNSATMPAGDVYISSLTSDMPFCGDTKLTEVLAAADAVTPDWRYGLTEQIEETVDVSSLVSIQPGVTPAVIESAREKIRSGVSLERPYTIKHEGRHYIWNGHHRALAAVLEGAKLIAVIRLIETR